MKSEEGALLPGRLLLAAVALCLLAACGGHPTPTPTAVHVEKQVVDTMVEAHLEAGGRFQEGLWSLMEYLLDNIARACGGSPALVAALGLTIQFGSYAGGLDLPLLEVMEEYLAYARANEGTCEELALGTVQAIAGITE